MLHGTGTQIRARSPWYAQVLAYVVVLPLLLLFPFFAAVAASEGSAAGAAILAALTMLWLTIFLHTTTWRLHMDPDHLTFGSFLGRVHVRRSDNPCVVNHPIYAHVAIFDQRNHGHNVPIEKIPKRLRRHAQALLDAWQTPPRRLPRIDHVGTGLLWGTVWGIMLALISGVVLWTFLDNPIKGVLALLPIGFALSFVLGELAAASARITPDGVVLRKGWGRWETLPWHTITLVDLPPEPHPHSYWSFRHHGPNVALYLRLRDGTTRRIACMTHPPGATALLLHTLGERRGGP